MSLWGNFVGIVRGNSAQNDSSKPDYIRNKPDEIVGESAVFSKKISGLPVPTDGSDASSKEYVDSRHINGEVTLTANGWSNNTQTVSFPGVTADGSLTDIYASPRPDEENYTAYTENGVRLYAQGENTLTFKCEDVPGVNVYVNVSVEFVGSYVPSGGDLPAWEGGSY